MFHLFLKSLLMPPGLFVLAGIVCLASHRRWPRVSLGILGISTLILWALSTVFVAKHLARWVEPGQALSQQAIETFQPQAIVLLGAGRISGSPEYSGDDAPGGNMLIRMRYAANLQRQTGLPVLVSGGRGYYSQTALAATAAKVLEQEFQIPVDWQEGDSLTTWENAEFSRDILQPLGINRILLVTQAFHMKRSATIFSQFGFQCLSAPTGFESRFNRSYGPSDFYPNMEGLRLSTLIIHEIVGLAYYRLKGMAVSP